MAEPSSYEEFERRFHDNHRIGGYYLDVHTVCPCPFCGAPEFCTWYTVAGIAPGDNRPSLDAQMGEESTCAECGRSGRFLVDRDDSGVAAEFVQTGGPDPPGWLRPAPRRVEREGGDDVQ